MRRMVSVPSESEMWLSITTTSGHSAALMRTASAPLEASPTTARWGSSARSMRSPRRCKDC